MSLIQHISRLCLNPVKTALVRSLHSSQPRYIQATAVLCAEPLKKKKKLDPAVIKARDDRKKKKLEKQIRRLEKNARQLKPIDELEVPLHLIDERKQRLRVLPKLTQETVEYRALLEKKWAKHKLGEKLDTYHILDRVMQAQTKALDELRLESEELYQKALEPDTTMMPFKAQVVVATPPIENYESPDGEYIDASKKWE